MWKTTRFLTLPSHFIHRVLSSTSSCRSRWAPKVRVPRSRPQRIRTAFFSGTTFMALSRHSHTRHGRGSEPQLHTPKRLNWGHADPWKVSSWKSKVRHLMSKSIYSAIRASSHLKYDSSWEMKVVFSSYVMTPSQKSRFFRNFSSKNISPLNSSSILHSSALHLKNRTGLLWWPSG